MRAHKLLSALSILLVSGTMSLAQVPSYVPTSGLQAWLGFNGNANDLSGNANNATNNGATFTADRNGNASAAANFNGTTNYMVISTPSFQFSPTGAFTYSFWLNKQTQSSGADIALMSGTSTTGVFITLIQGANNFTYGTNKQQSAWVFTSCAHTLNVWDHYVTTYNAGVMKIYKNGVFQSTATYSYTGATTATIPFYIGKGIAATGGNFKGGIDDIGIWDRELSQTEINDLFTSITSVPQLNQSTSISIFPNPAFEKLTVKSSPYEMGQAYQIIELDGKVLVQGKIEKMDMEIDIKDLSIGTYLFEVNHQKASALRFIKGE